MADHGHEAGEGAYATWASTTTTARPEVVRRHLVEPDLLQGWVPGAEAVTVDGDVMRMEILIDPRSASAVTFTTSAQGGDALHVTRTWAAARTRTRFTDRAEDPDVQVLDVAWALAPAGAGTGVGLRIDTRVPGTSARITRVSARAQARSLDRALDRLVLAAEDRRPSLLGRLATVVAVGPL